MENQPLGDELYTIDESAAYLKLSRSAVYDLITAGHLLTVKFPGNEKRAPRRIRGLDLRAFVEQHLTSAGQ